MNIIERIAPQWALKRIATRQAIGSVKRISNYSEGGASKKKKSFDLVIVISEHKKITITTIEQIQEFIELYKDIIEKYDNDNKQIYASRLKDSIEKGLKTIELMAEVNKKEKVLSE